LLSLGLLFWYDARLALVGIGLVLFVVAITAVSLSLQLPLERGESSLRGGRIIGQARGLTDVPVRPRQQEGGRDLFRAYRRLPSGMEASGVLRVGRGGLQACDVLIGGCVGAEASGALRGGRRSRVRTRCVLPGGPGYNGERASDDGDNDD